MAYQRELLQLQLLPEPASWCQRKERCHRELRFRERIRMRGQCKQVTAANR